MTIREAIAKMKEYHLGSRNGRPIDDATTRDQILYGDPDRELTGIVTTIYASLDTIRRAHEAGANLIISHEALFWNHGDHTEWLADNKTFQAKTALLDECGIVVWRDHDYIHSGIPLGDGVYSDGIFYGLMKELGWEEYLSCDIARPIRFTLPRTTIRGLGKELMQKMPLLGLKIIGDPDSPCREVWIPGHIDGRMDNEILKTMEEEDIDTVIALECTDYTVAEYVRDSTMAGRAKTLVVAGHFNVEEPGMKYMVQYIPEALGEEVPCRFVASTDMFRYL